MERTMLICDGLEKECGKPARGTVLIKPNGSTGSSLALDLCGDHHKLLLSKGHTPKRGRSYKPVTAAPGPERKSRRRKKTAAKKPSPQ